MELQETIDIKYDQIEGQKQKLSEDHYMNPEQEGELEELIESAIKFGELCAQRDLATPEVLNAPARVGGVVFREGIKWSTVIESAQRLYEYSKDEIKPIVSPADMLKIACGDLVLVPKEKISSLVGELHTAFQSTPTLTLGDLLPLQQDFQAMIEAQEQSHD